MKPSVTIDERGALLHVTTSTGEQISIPLEAETVFELAAGFERVKSALKTPEGKSTLLRGLGRLLTELAQPKQVQDGRRKKR